MQCPRSTLAFPMEVRQAAVSAMREVLRFAHAEDPPRRIYVTTLSQRTCSNLQIVADALKDAIVARGLTKAEALRVRDSLKAACAKLGWPVAAVSCA